MCVIASLPKGKTITNKTLDQMWKRNPDGGGIAWIENGKIQVFKTMKLKAFKTKFKEVTKKYGNSDIVVHMRIATHGSVCIENNHPFHVDPQTVFAHNGILPNEFHPPAKSDLSDTRHFNNVFLQHMKPVALDDVAFTEMVGDLIGFNKLVFLSANKKLKKESYIINERLGVWDKGVWYSNDHHLPTKSSKKTVTTFGNYDYQRGWSQDQIEYNYDTCVIEDYDDWYIEADGRDINYAKFVEGVIPPEFQDDERIEDMVWSMHSELAFMYEDLQMLMDDYALVFNEKTKSFKCQICGKKVDAELDRACAKTCDGAELEFSR